MKSTDFNSWEDYLEVERKIKLEDCSCGFKYSYGRPLHEKSCKSHDYIRVLYHEYILRRKDFLKKNWVPNWGIK